MQQKFKTTFIIKTKNKPRYFNITFFNKKLFQKHQQEVFLDIKNIIIFSCKSIDNQIEKEDIKLYSIEGNKKFIDYEDKDVDIEINDTFLFL